MIKELHGKHYYIEVDNRYQAKLLMAFLDYLGVFNDENFSFYQSGDKKCVMSNALCGSRKRGPKYVAWSYAKTYIQSLKKCSYHEVFKQYCNHCVLKRKFKSDFWERYIDSNLTEAQK